MFLHLELSSFFLIYPLLYYSDFLYLLLRLLSISLLIIHLITLIIELFYYIIVYFLVFELHFVEVILIQVIKLQVSKQAFIFIFKPLFFDFLLFELVVFVIEVEVVFMLEVGVCYLQAFLFLQLMVVSIFSSSQQAWLKVIMHLLLQELFLHKHLKTSQKQHIYEYIAKVSQFAIYKKRIYLRFHTSHNFLRVCCNLLTCHHLN